jgi:hypothetical protein
VTRVGKCGCLIEDFTMDRTSFAAEHWVQREDTRVGCLSGLLGFIFFVNFGIFSVHLHSLSCTCLHPETD